MPSFNSREGVWLAAKERVALHNYSGKTKVINGKKVKPGEPYIYEGDDRAALLEFHKAGVTQFGENFRTNTEFLQAIRNMGFDSVDKYLESIRYNSEEVAKRFEKESAEITQHDIAKKVEAIQTLGGKDTASGKVLYKGGFDEMFPVEAGR